MMDAHDEPHSYRMYFLGRTGEILAREDFDATGDECAIAMATALFDACSDECSGFELWYGLRRVDVGMRRRQPFSQEMEEAVIAHLEVIRDSDWAIAKSRRLLERLAARKAHVWQTKRRRPYNCGMPTASDEAGPVRAEPGRKFRSP